jgi:hypothetical protein
MPEKTTFYSGGLKLAAILDLPSGGGGGWPGVVLCQGPGGTKEYLVNEVAAWLNREGYACLRFDYRGWGESEGASNRLIPLEQAEDIRNALTFLGLQPGVAPARLGLWGAATGGALVSYVAAVDPRVRCMVGVNGMGDFGRWFQGTRPYWDWKKFEERLAEDRNRRVTGEKSSLVDLSEVTIRDPVTAEYARKQAELHPQQYKAGRMELTMESVEAMAEFRAVDYVSRISPRAAMWVVAGKDTLVPTEESASMFRAAGEPKRLLVVENEKHHALYSGQPFQKLMTESAAWFKQHLKR